MFEGAASGLGKFLATKSPLKIMKNAFYLALKAFFVLEIFSHVGKRLDKKAKVMPDNARSKDNQTSKFGQLIENNMRNIFLEKLCTKCYGETSYRPFLKNR